MEHLIAWFSARTDMDFPTNKSWFSREKQDQLHYALIIAKQALLWILAPLPSLPDRDNVRRWGGSCKEHWMGCGRGANNCWEHETK